MKLFLSGPMRNCYQYNATAFNNAEKALRAVGYDVCNPVTLDKFAGFDALTWEPPAGWDWSQVPEGFDVEATHDNCLKELVKCEGLCYLPGYTQSVGARMEYNAAVEIQLPVGNLDYWITNT